MTIAPEHDLAALRASLHGIALVPGEPQFGAACQGFNLAAVHSPDVIVQATSTDDVVAAVRHAARAGMTVSVQSTGHGIGIPARDGMLITTSQMRSLSIDPEAGTACAGAGIIWRDVIEAAAPHGLAPLNGSSVTIGVVGYMLGGGMGPMGRTFGFAADHVRRFELVTADGDVLEVTADTEPDLFWALRGGKCAIGIVTEIEFELMKVPHYYGGAIFYPGEAAREVLHAFRAWVKPLPEHTTTSIALLRLPDVVGIPEPLRGKLSVHLRFVHVGDEQVGAALLATMRDIIEPMIDLVAVTPYSAIASVHQDPEDPMPAWDGAVLLRELPAEAIDAILAVAGPEVDVPLILTEIRYLGGALGREAIVPNAVGHGVLSAVAPWATGGTQINFQGADTAPDDVHRAWPEATAARLQEIKRTRDPHGQFRFGYSLN